MVKVVGVGGSVIFISALISEFGVVLGISISSIEKGNRVSRSGSKRDRGRRVVGRDIDVSVIERISKISSGARVRNGDSLSLSVEWDRNERAVPSSSSVSANLRSVGEGNSSVVSIIIGVKNDPEISSSRSVASNRVDRPVSNIDVRSVVAVVRGVRRSSVRSSIDLKRVGIDRGVDGQNEVSGVKRNGVLEDGEGSIISRNSERRREGRDSVISSRALRVRIAR